MNERGMKKWLPYKSLDRQSDFLSKMAHRKSEVAKPLLSNEEAERINEMLCSYDGETVLVSYYEEGHIFDTFGVIDEIDTIYKYIKINDIIVHFSNLIGLE